MKVFSARLDDATEKFAKTNTPDSMAGAAAAYMSKQLILLTDMSATLCNAVVDLANEVERIKK